MGSRISVYEMMWRAEMDTLKVPADAKHLREKARQIALYKKQKVGGN